MEDGAKYIAFPNLVRYIFELQVPLFKGDLGGSSVPHMRENRYNFNSLLSS
jgi:hypothetical protein